MALNVGTNPIDIKVTAQDGTTIKTYTITVTRAVGNITWTGVTSNSWSTASNWNTNAVPGTTADVVIPSGTPNSPSYTSFSTIASLSIASGATLTNSGVLNITNGLTNAGTINFGTTNVGGPLINNGSVIGNGTITLNGLSAQTIAGIGTIAKLTINNSAGVTISSGSTSVTGVLTAQSGILTAGGNLVLSSNSTGTAALAAIDGTVNTGSITGNVTVERYIPSMNRKAYTMVTSPVSSPTIYTAWQEGGAATAGYGTQITGGTGTTIANGFDGTSAAGFASALTYNDTLATGSKWVQIANTNATLLAPGKGYVTYVRGDRTIAPSSTATNNTTLRATGTLSTGNVSPVLTATTNSKFNLIGNPYASAIDWTSGITKTNVNDAFWVFDPNISPSGSFVTYNNGVVSPSDALVTQYLQSGQAFFIQNAASGTPSITFTEAAKTTAAGTGVGNTVFGIQTPITRLNINVYKADNSLVDGVVVVFGNEYKAGLGKEDAAKMDNFNETFALRRNGQVLSIEGRPLVSGKDTLFFNIKNFSKNVYSLNICAVGFAGSNAMLEDKYTGTKQPLGVAGSTIYKFNVNGDEASAANDRFIITFGNTANNVAPDAASANSLFVKASPNPMKNRLHVSFKTATAENTVINIVNSLGQVVKTVNAGKINMGSMAINVGSLAVGNYYVQLISGDKKIAVQKLVKEVN